MQPRLSNGVVGGDAASLAAIDALVVDGVLRDPIVRVKIWAPDGTIVYSDVPELIGERFDLGTDELAALRTNTVEADISNLSEPENRFERDFGQLLEVYLPVATPTETAAVRGIPPYDSVTASARSCGARSSGARGGALALAGCRSRSRTGSPDGCARANRTANGSYSARSTPRTSSVAGSPATSTTGPSSSSRAVDVAVGGRRRLDPEGPGAAAALRDAAERTRQGMRSLRSSLMGTIRPLSAPGCRPRSRT